ASGAAAPATTAFPRAGTLTSSASALGLGVVDPGAGKVALEADPGTGKLYIVGDNANINSYEIISAGNKLTFVSTKSPGGYDTLTKQTATDSLPGSSNAAEDSWAVISSAPNNFVAEAYPAQDSPAYDTLGPGLQVFDLNVS